jgi:Amt family ammonium transporter
MGFLTALNRRKIRRLFYIFLGLIFTAGWGHAAPPATNSDSPAAGSLNLNLNSLPATNMLSGMTNAPSVATTNLEVTPAAPTTTEPIAPPPPTMSEPPPAESLPLPQPVWNFAGSILGAVMTLASLAGFVLYYCGLTRAKNSGHTAALLLVGAVVGLLGYWIGGFALQSGGMGDAHAALMQAPDRATASALDHELGFLALGHHWGLMGSAGFFLATDDASRNGIAALFLVQAAMALLVITAALGAALERAKILAMVFCAYLIGVLVFPLFANWTWGGGWLAETGRELHLGNGFVDPGGAGVVHQTAGTLALVLAVVLGPRRGRFGRTQPSFAIPGHNVPFLVLGTIVLLLSWMAANGFIFAGLPVDPSEPVPVSCAGLAVANTLLAAIGGLIASYVHATAQKDRPEPARLCRGLLGGAVASCGCAGLVDPWAAFLIGCIAGALVQFAVVHLARRHIDDPVGASAVHGAAGAWGVLATGLFANGAGGYGLNGVPQPVRGFFFGGGLHQLGAQILGCATGFALVYLLGYACVSLVQKIFGNRVDLAVEGRGLDWTETGALGYQGDTEAED